MVSGTALDLRQAVDAVCHAISAGRNRALDGTISCTPVRRPHRRCLPAPARPRYAGGAADRTALPSCRNRTHGSRAAASRRSGGAGPSTRRGIAAACASSRPVMSCPGRDRMTLMRPAPATDGERWIDDGRTVGAWHEPPQRPACPRHEPEASAVSGTASLEMRQVVDALCRSIPLDSAELTDEFFPAHLSVALIDAVSRSRLRYAEQPAPIAERYCRHFGIARCRADRWEPPAVDEQETLGDLVQRYDDHGVDRIASEVFRCRRSFPGANVTRAEGRPRRRASAPARRGRRAPERAGPARRGHRRSAPVRARVRPARDPHAPDVHRRRGLRAGRQPREEIRGERHWPTSGLRGSGRRPCPARCVRTDSLAPAAGPGDLALRHLRHRGGQTAGAARWVMNP